MKNKILIWGMSDFPGGIESVIMNYLINMNLDNLQFDFLVCSDKKMAYEKDVKKLGSKVFYLPQKRKNPLKYFIKMNNFFKVNAIQYKALWFNTNNLANIDAVKFAKKYNIKYRIIHSHNSRLTSKGLDAIIKNKQHVCNKNKISNVGTNFWACSNLAAKWLFPDEVLSSVKFIPNAISSNKYKYNKSAREKIRKNLVLQNKIVIGNVGRLYFQKNQLFLLDIFKELSKSLSNVRLILVGDGPDKKTLASKIKELDLENKVYLVGKQTNIQDWYNAFDVLVFPSLFEGLPVVLLEAQANGLPVIASKNVIPGEIKINSNYYTVSLDDSVKKWSKSIESVVKDTERLSRTIINKNFLSTGFELKPAAKKLEKFFIDLE